MVDTNYQQQTLMGATGVEMVVALYDGAIRFLHRASQCCREDDVRERRIAVGRAVDILMYLQATLRTDVGGKVAASLDDFYVTMFTMALEASYYGSEDQMQEVIGCLRNVRDAWVLVAKDPKANRVLPRDLRTRDEAKGAMVVPRPVPVEAAQSARWSA